MSKHHKIDIKRPVIDVGKFYFLSWRCLQGNKGEPKWLNVY